MPRMPMLSICYFNSRPSARGDKSKNLLNSLYGIFQFTPLREGRPARGKPPLPSKNFNSRPSARGDAWPRLPRHPECHFNSRPSARGDPLRRFQRRNLPISIHAPPRGATEVLVVCRRAAIISIHAPPRGATRRPRQAAAARRHFNSRPSARGDTRHAAQAAVFPISIHAPPRGATRHRVHVLVGGQFQFTPLREGRPEVLDGFLRLLLFQFTPLREGRPELRIVKQRTYAFQFTPLREGRRLLLVGITGIKIFQFTPLREGRPCIVAGRSCTKPNFNSRPSARGDGGARAGYADLFISIHAPPRGATAQGNFIAEVIAFQFTPLREGRR